MSATIGSLKPYGIPDGLDPRKWRQAVAQRVNELLDQTAALISALDLMETECDLEDGADHEPSLGWGVNGQTGTTLDLELVDEDGGDINDEPQDEDEREADPDDIDQPGFIEGGQGALGGVIACAVGRGSFTLSLARQKLGGDP
jgi:hypothetical protein